MKVLHKTEVTEHDVTSRRKEDVGGFDITMDDPTVMEKGDSNDLYARCIYSK